MKQDRRMIIGLIDEAMAAGARQSKACEIIGMSAKTYQRWCQEGNTDDSRVEVKRTPANKLTALERQRILSLVNEPDYAHLPPSQIVPKLADEGRYIGSESTFYRVLKETDQLKHRQSSKPVQARAKPRALTATAPNQLYSWDITYLPTAVKGVFYYLYLVLDVYSRKIVGWQVHDEERAALAADLMTDICQREGVTRDQVVLHSDNGSPMKGATMLATLQQLGVMPSFSRPSVSNDNPYSESLFRTLKYRSDYPAEPFASLVEARRWVASFERWYNYEHRHSAIRFVTPVERHNGKDRAILAHRKDVYRQAHRANPLRWSGHTRNWSPVTEVQLNPERCKTEKHQKLAA